jgi:hypothetical protein
MQKQIIATESIMNSTLRLIEWKEKKTDMIHVIQQKSAMRVALFLRFPWDTIERFKKRQLDIYKYSLWYFRGPQWIEKNSDTSQQHHYIEWPHSLVLYFDHKPLCNVSYSITKDAIFIHQIQWVRYDYGRKDEDWFSKKTDNFELSKFEWAKVMVSLVEELGVIKDKKYVYIQPAIYNVSPWARWDSWEKIYEGTASDLHYSHDIAPITVILPAQIEWKRVMKIQRVIGYRKKLQ